MHRTTKIVVSVLAGSLALGACGAEEPTGTRTASGFPMTVMNCGRQVTIDDRPQRVLTVGDAPVSSLHAAGATDALVARAGEPADPVYGPDVRAAIDDVPVIDATRDGQGHTELSKEAVIGQQPDLVIGYATNTVTPEALAAAEIPMLVPSGYCGTDHGRGSGDGDADFDDMYADVELYGRVLGTEEAANAAVAKLRERVTSIGETAGPGEERTAAALFVSSASVSAYGNASISHTQMDKVGLTNVFGDVDKRVFEVNLEELLARDPDVLVLLYNSGEPTETLLDYPGVADLTAIGSDAVMVQRFSYTDPPCPLSVTGLENMAEKFGVSPR